jgi:stringent starvation protein B
MSEISTKPYLLRAIYEWCTDNGFTPYMSVKVNGGVQVPMEFVRKGEIILNVSFGATSGLKMDNQAVTFKARFGGISREIYVPIANVQAIFASENGQGMVFDEVVISPEESAPTEQATIKPGPSLVAMSPVVSVAYEAKAEAENKLSTAKVSTEVTHTVEKKHEKPSLKIIK